MRKIILSSLLIFIFTLTGCQSKDKNTTEEMTGNQISSSSSQEHIKEAVFNGSYYSVEGKYGPIIIVNKKHPLATDYAPGEDSTALTSFQELVTEMQNQGYGVSNSYSGFRSYETQETLYQNYVSQDGQEEADRYSARPSFSEHQTGLAYDLLDTSGSLLTEPEAVYWLKENAAKYGFIIRYVEGKEGVTGYMAESWHIRYIGQEAKEIADSGLTLEEYLGLEGGDYTN